MRSRKLTNDNTILARPSSLPRRTRRSGRRYRSGRRDKLRVKHFLTMFCFLSLKSVHHNSNSSPTSTSYHPDEDEPQATELVLTSRLTPDTTLFIILSRSSACSRKALLACSSARACEAIVSREARRFSFSSWSSSGVLLAGELDLAYS